MEAAAIAAGPVATPAIPPGRSLTSVAAERVARESFLRRPDERVAARTGGGYPHRPLLRFVRVPPGPRRRSDPPTGFVVHLLASICESSAHSRWWTISETTTSKELRRRFHYSWVSARHDQIAGRPGRRVADDRGLQVHKSDHIPSVPELALPQPRPDCPVEGALLLSAGRPRSRRSPSGGAPPRRGIIPAPAPSAATTCASTTSRRPSGAPLCHRSGEATMVYTHVLNRGGRGVQSPADLL